LSRNGSCGYPKNLWERPLGEELLANKQVTEAQECFIESVNLKVIKYSYQAVFVNRKEGHLFRDY